MHSVQPELDFFPATVVTGDGQVYEKARVIVHKGRAFVFATAAGIPYIAAEGSLPGGWVPSGLPYILDVEGGEWKVAKTPGCGCGAVVKGLSCDVLLGLAGVTR